MTKISMRPYQAQAIDSTLRYWNRGGQKPLLSIFTGGGKAFMGLALGLEVGGFREKELPGRVAYLAHTKELTDQPYYSLYRLLPSLKGKYYGAAPAAGIVRAARNQANARFLFATMQTLAGSEGKRLDEVLLHGAFDLVIVDEAHHSMAKSYCDIILPKFLEANPNTKILGLTATAARSDGKALDGIFDDITYSMNILDGIRGGWLKALTAKSVETYVSLGAIARYKDDFKQSQLARVLSTQNWVDIVLKAYFEHDGPDRYTMAFMPSVEMGKELCAGMQDAGILAAAVFSSGILNERGEWVESGNGKYARERERVIEAFRNSELQVLGGYSVLLEGFDAQNANMILQGRPTESTVLLTQLIGRGLRTPDGVARLMQDKEKGVYLVQRDGQEDWVEYRPEDLPFAPDCLVLDFTLKDTPVLLAGSLAGNRIETPDVSEATEETMEFLTVEPVANDFEIALKRGEGVKYAQRNFFKLADENWCMWHDGSHSTWLGATGEGSKKIGNALFIYPRQKTMMSRLELVARAIEDMAMDEQEREKLLIRTHTFLEMFGSFRLFQLKNVPVNVSKNGAYENEFIVWNSSQIEVVPLGKYADAHAAWERALPLSQELSTGGFFVDKNRPGKRNDASHKQINLLLEDTYSNGKPNMYAQLPAKVNNAFLAVPGLELFTIEKPIRKTLAGEASVRVSGMINHVGAYSVVMLKSLGARLVQAQQLYNTHVAGVYES